MEGYSVVLCGTCPSKQHYVICWISAVLCELGRSWSEQMRSEECSGVNPFEPPRSRGRSRKTHGIFLLAIRVFLILIGVASLGMLLNGIWDLLGTIPFMGRASEIYLAPIRQKGLGKVVVGAIGLFGMAIGLVLLFMRNRQKRSQLDS